MSDNSYVIYSDNSKNILEVVYGINDIPQGQLLKGVVSRKKQIVPNILEVLSN